MTSLKSKIATCLIASFAIVSAVDVNADERAATSDLPAALQAVGGQSAVVDQATAHSVRGQNFAKSLLAIKPVFTFAHANPAFINPYTGKVTQTGVAITLPSINKTTTISATVVSNGAWKGKLQTVWFKIAPAQGVTF